MWRQCAQYFNDETFREIATKHGRDSLPILAMRATASYRFRSAAQAAGVASTEGTAIRMFLSTPHRFRGATGSSCRMRPTSEHLEQAVPRASAGHAGCG